MSSLLHVRTPDHPGIGSVYSVKSHSRKRQTARSHSVYLWFSHQRPVRVGFHCQVRCDHYPRRQCSLYGLNRQFDNRGGSSRPCPPLDCLQRRQSNHICYHHHRFNELATKSEKWNGKPRLECVDSRHPPSKTPVRVLPWTCRSEGKWPSRQTGGQSNPHKWLASRKIWCWEAWDTTCGHKAKDITPSITWRREAWKMETLDDLPWKDERGRPSSIRRTLEPFQRQCWGKLLRDGVEHIWALPSA